MITRKLISKMFSVLLIVISLLTEVLPAQAGPLFSLVYVGGDFLWAKSMGGTSYDSGNAIVVDSSGNVYTTGKFFGTVDFDPGEGIFNLTSAGSNDDIFVSKLDNSGNFLWAKRMGGWSDDEGYSIAVDSSGVYTTGIYQSNNADFDPGVGTYILTGAGGNEIFVSKLDNNGDFVWARSIGGWNGDKGNAIVVDSSRNVYTTGYFRNTADFDPGAGVFNLSTPGNTSDPDIFVSKLDINGDFVWAKSMGGAGSDYDEGYSIVVDSSQNVYTTGFFVGTADFDPGVGILNLISVGGRDVFFSKLNINGNFVWAKSIGGTDSYDEGHDIALDSNGNVYTTGYFRATVDFDPGAGISNITSAGLGDIFVAKLDTNGSFVWAKSMGGADGDEGNSITIDSSNNIYTTGYYEPPADFDPGAGTFNLTSAGIFVSKLDSNGNFVWAKGMGGVSYYDIGYSIVLDSSRNIYTTGSYYGTADFDPGAGIFNLTSAGNSDIFISKLEKPTIFEDVPTTYWASSFIERLYNAGITGGCTTAPLNYCPTTPVTRAQMAIFLLRGIYGSAYIPPTATGTVFNDVPLGTFGAAWIEQLATEGITSGCGGGNYCPTQTVSRAQMAIFLVRARHGSTFIPPTATGIFLDVPIGSFGANFIEQLVTDAITSGCGSGNFCPNTMVKRDSMAVFLVKTFNLP